jgi:phasin family protein
MFITADQISSANQANLEAAKDMSTKVYSGFEKMVELNMTATKAVLTESFAHVQAVMAAKDAQQLMALQAGLLAPMAEKTVAYGRHVQAIVTDASSDFTKAFEEKTAEGQKAVAQVIDNLAKNAPAGSETVMAAMKSAISTGQSAMEAAQKAAKQVVTMTEANVAAATEQALTAAASVSTKA